MRVAIFAILITTCSSTAPAQGRWEGPKTFQASKILGRRRGMDLITPWKRKVPRGLLLRVHASHPISAT